MIRVEVRSVDDDRVLLQVGDDWHLVMSPDAARTIGGMLLAHAKRPGPAGWVIISGELPATGGPGD